MRNLWFILGEYPDGCVDIVDRDGDVMTWVTRELAEAIVEVHNA
jgi:(2Fe-2S) ferredoxin